jgi:hypothetical protein
MAVTSTAWAGAAAGEEDVAEAAGGVGLVGAAVPAVLVGEATAGEAGAALVVGAAVACPNIFDMKLVNVPITAKDTPRPDKKPAQPFYFLQFTEGVDVERGSPSFLAKAQPRKNNMPRSVDREAVSRHKGEAGRVEKENSLLSWHGRRPGSAKRAKNADFKPI